MAGPKLRAFRERALLRALQSIAFIGRRIPLRLGQRLGWVLGALGGVVARRERRKALQNIAIAFPDWSDQQRRRTVDAMFRHLGTSVFEIVWLPNLDAARRDATTTIEGLDPLLQLIRDGRSVVAFTGHCGNWEWLAYCAGMSAPVSVLQRERTERGLGDFISGIRAHAGIRTIDRGSSGTGRELIQVMRQPGFVAFLIDQSIRVESAKVPFFGRPALTPIGAAKLAIRTGAVVVSTFIERRPDGTHLIRFLDPIETRRDDDPIAMTARITADIEAQVRRVPEQWVWMHDRWRDRPKWDVGNAESPGSG